MKWYNWRKKFWNTRRAISSWQIHWHASSLTSLINIHAAGQSNGPLLRFLLLYWIVGIGIVIHYKHSLIHSYIQRISKPESNLNTFKYGTNLVTNWPQRQSLFHENPRTRRSPWEIATPEISQQQQPYWLCLRLKHFSTKTITNEKSEIKVK